MKSKRHRKNSKGRHKQRHGNKSGNVTGKCGHDQLLLIPFMFSSCSIFVPSSSAFDSNNFQQARRRPRALIQPLFRRSEYKKARALLPGLVVMKSEI
ncbi:hypothetical protein [uncultured Hoeflea sp.]|uniref:hypothetical protein n=1 Tax=uncultured Hoeflea sp. TaxID=538666 RepID=UPI0030DD8BFE